MSTDNKRAPNEQDDDGYEAGSHAADEPTAVWDESALRAAGLTELLKKRDSEPPAPPATPVVPAPLDPSILVDHTIHTPVAPLPPVPATPLPVVETRRSGGLGWGATLAIALALGALVYLVVRLVRG